MQFPLPEPGLQLAQVASSKKVAELDARYGEHGTHSDGCDAPCYARRGHISLKMCHEIRQRYQVGRTERAALEPDLGSRDIAVAVNSGVVALMGCARS